MAGQPAQVQVTHQRISPAAFDALVQTPPYTEHDWELIAGEMYQVASNNLSSAVAANVLIAIGAYVRANKLGWVTGADGGYVIDDERYIPDVAYTSAARQAEPSRSAYNPLPPDLAVEVLSPSNSPAQTRIKVVNYLAAGAAVWVIDPQARRVEYYLPGQPVQVLAEGDTLSGGDLLPGFEINVADLF